MSPRSFVRVRLALVAVLAALAVAGRPAAAQVVESGPPLVPGQPFSGMGATPLSGTTVMHFVLAPDSARGGARLVYALLVRGAPGWYRQRTMWGADSAGGAPGFETTWWEVGPVHYTVAHAAGARRLRAFGRDVDLSRSSALLVTLGSAEANGAVGARAEPGPLFDFFIADPRDLAARLLAEVPALRAFAADGPVR